MEQTKDAEGPGEREEEVEERAGVKDEGVPLGQEREAAIAERVPERDFTLPETLAVMKSQRISEKPKVAKEKCSETQNDVRVSRKNE